MQHPEQIIGNIRKIRFGIGLNKVNLSDDQKAALQDKDKILKDAAGLAREINTKKPHFILELIQNAEDNEYVERVKPKVKFIVTSNELIIQNNEKGLLEENVWALCGIGESTKKNKKSGYIGEKGIGFKSVFMVTDEPHIYSNGFQFKFKYDKENPISIIIPEWVNKAQNFVDTAQTNIVLPLKSETKTEIIDYIQQIHPSVLLFLRKLKLLEIENKKQDTPVKIERRDYSKKVIIVHEKTKIHWKVIKKKFKREPNIEELRRKDIEETEIILAFPLNKDGTANTYNEQFVFSFLPVCKYGFKFIIQADFLLPVSREDIIKDNDWNKWLRNSISSVFLQAVEQFKKDRNLKKSFYNYIPLKTKAEITDEFFLPIVDQIYNDLRATDCILTESKKESWRKPSDVFYEDDELRELISNEDLKSFFDKEYVYSKLKANPEILRTLGVQEFGFEHILQCLQEKEWLKKQSDDWFIKLYSYLDRYAKPEQLQELKKLKIIRLERDDELASNIDKPIFFPLDKKGNYGFEKELQILKRTIFEPKEKKKKGAVINFLKKIDVRDASPYEIIEEHILPIYENNDDSSNWKSGKPLLGYIRYIKDHFEDYKKDSDKRLNSDKKEWEEKEDPLKRLKNSLFIQINKTVEGSKYYVHPKNIYLPKAYGNENDLEALFEGISDISFVSHEYIKDITSSRLTRKNKKSKKNLKIKQEGEIREWRTFFIKLGVHLIPKVIIEKEIRRHITYWGNEHKREVTIYRSPDIFSIIELKSAEKNKKLLLILDRNWDHYKKFKDWTDWFFSYNWKYQRNESDWFEKIRTANWLPNTKNIDHFAIPNEVFLDKPEIRALLGDDVPYLAVDIKNQEFIKAVGINSEATVEGVLNYLRSIVQQRCLDVGTFIKFYTFLNKNYESNEKIIKTAFSENQNIFIPNNQRRYFIIRDVLWKNASDIFGENRGYLEQHYPKLKSFFVEKLGVREKPTPKDYADFLIDLSRKETIDKNDEKIILEIYKELNSHLNSENNEHLISAEEWWKDLLSEPIFRTEKEEFWKNDNDVFINDNQEIYELFKENPQIAFLKLPRNYYPKIQYFIGAVGVPYLSKAVEINLKEIKNPKIEADLTEQIRKFFPYILRYLYQADHEVYERIKRLGILTQLKNLTCCSVEGLQVEYTLNHQSALSQQKIFLDESHWRLYIQNDSLEDTDRLAVAISEFSIFSEKLKGLDYFLISLFDRKTGDKIEKLLKAKGIQELPDGERDEFIKEKSSEGELQPKSESQEKQEISETEPLEDSQQERTKGKESEWLSEPEFKEKEERTQTEPTDDFQQDRTKGAESEQQHESESQEKEEIPETKPVEQDRTQVSEDEWQTESESREKDEKSETESNIDFQQDRTKEVESEQQPEPQEKEERTEPIEESQQERTKGKESDWLPECDPENVEIHIEEFQARETKVHRTPDVTGSHGKSRPTSSNDEDEVTANLSQNAKKAIGRWGEEYALKCLEEKLYTKYPEGNVEETEDGFTISLNGQIIVEVHWLNKIGDEGKGHDIKIIENNNEEYIEVKSTKTDTKDWFELSRKQWELAQEMGDNFHIYRIYNAGTKQAKLVDIPDPSKLWQEGSLIAYPIRIQI